MAGEGALIYGKQRALELERKANEARQRAEMDRQRAEVERQAREKLVNQTTANQNEAFSNNKAFQTPVQAQEQAKPQASPTAFTTPITPAAPQVGQPISENVIGASQVGAKNNPFGGINFSTGKPTQLATSDKEKKYSISMEDYKKMKGA